MEQAYEITPNDGKTVFVGVPNDKISIYSLPLAFNKTLSVSHGGGSIPDRDIPRYVRYSRVYVGVSPRGTQGAPRVDPKALICRAQISRKSECKS